MRADSSPLVTIGMPVYNCAATLGAAIRSILNQTLKDWELLLLYDDSADNTLELAKSFGDPRIRLITDGNHHGLPARLNQAVETGRGKYFARMDADDVAFPHRLQRQVAFLEEHRNVDLVGCSVLVFQEQGKAIGMRPVFETHMEICRCPWAGFPLFHPTWMGRMEWFREHRYRSNLARAEDQELLLRSHTTSSFGGIAEVLLGYRESSLSLGKMLGGRYVYAKAVLREFCKRGKIFTALRGVFGQSAKALVDIFAVSTGMNHRILRHRARPIGCEVIDHWTDIWQGLQKANAQRLPCESLDIGTDNC